MFIMKQYKYYTNITNFEINNQYRYSNDTFFTSRRFLCIYYLQDGLYIMTQCPLPKMTANFWQMIWEQNVPSIVVLSADHEQRNVCFLKLV